MKWIKPSGVEVETNDLKASVEAAKALGWKPKSEKKEEPIKVAKKKVTKKA